MKETGPERGLGQSEVGPFSREVLGTQVHRSTQRAHTLIGAWSKSSDSTFFLFFLFSSYKQGIIFPFQFNSLLLLILLYFDLTFILVCQPLPTIFFLV
ncbi:hypothetical protein DUNSADRAFT_12779 [Dunaliella salina]|uniref:Encoded protein n=1 Tax=Dunaliella salina TaxID=3046 RepID=A0ABQ7GAL7_DUNSA|nr:hypothetical protein DUNSADRAFT_12779 [Dunaliella salina]|eukprot:KAF5831651.1 hypothetical protein DUNSADRAFT_12779 [Dunaliella salina]